jgi:PAS domain S-box-containing protein
MTEPSQSEEARYWRALVENSPDIVMVVGMDGTVRFLNRSRPPFEGDQIVGSPIWRYTRDGAEERMRGILRSIAETRRAVRYEGPGYGAGGSTAWYEVSIVPLIVDGVVECVLWTAIDITARKKLEEGLRQSQKMEAVGLLAGGVAHDFNNLLGVIVGHSELAASVLPPDHPAQEDLREVGAAAQRGAALTRRLLSFSRKQIFQPRRIDLRAAVSDFAKMFGRIAGGDFKVVVESPPDPGSTVVRADAVQVEQVLLNLCTNARQAMPGGGRITLVIRPVVLDDAYVERHPGAFSGAFVEILVRDTGAGMDEATRARVFDPFFTTRQEGTGLGLAMVLGIVQQHGGQIQFESEKGHGTTFHVYLPVAVGESIPAPASAPG